MARTRRQLEQMVADATAARSLIAWALEHRTIDHDLRAALRIAQELGGFAINPPATSAQHRRRAKARARYHVMTARWAEQRQERQERRERVERLAALDPAQRLAVIADEFFGHA